MRMRCGHREGDVERGRSFAWRVRGSSRRRFLLAVAIAAGLTGAIFSSLRLVVRDSMALDGGRLPAVQLVRADSLRGSALERFVQTRSPVGAQDAGLHDLPSIADWLAELGIEDGSLWVPQLVERSSEEEQVAEPNLPWRLSLPEVDQVVFLKPELVKPQGVVLQGVGRLEGRFAARELEWSGDLPANQELFFWAVIDEAGKIEIALPESRDMPEEMLGQARGLLEREDFGAGKRRSGRLRMSFEGGME